jgi:hypothetical protein
MVFFEDDGVVACEPAHSPELAWKIVFAYARRWQIEMALRFNKSELAFESPRLLKWEARLKLLAIAGLAYAFLLSLLVPAFSDLRAWLLRTFCHRTGKRSWSIPAPLYRSVTKSAQQSGMQKRRLGKAGLRR